MLVIPALVKSDGRLLTLKFGGTGAPLTLAVNCVNRSRTRFAVIEIVEPAAPRGVTPISTVCPGQSRDASVAPSRPLTNPLRAVKPSSFSSQEGFITLT